MRFRPHGGGDLPATEGRPPRGLEHWSPHFRRVRAWRRPEAGWTPVPRAALRAVSPSGGLQRPVWRKEG